MLNSELSILNFTYAPIAQELDLYSRHSKLERHHEYNLQISKNHYLDDRHHDRLFDRNNYPILIEQRNPIDRIFTLFSTDDRDRWIDANGAHLESSASPIGMAKDVGIPIVNRDRTSSVDPRSWLVLRCHGDRHPREK